MNDDFDLNRGSGREYGEMGTHLRNSKKIESAKTAEFALAVFVYLLNPVLPSLHPF